MAVLTFARTARHELGFSLLELIVATTVLLVVSSIFTSGLMQVTRHQQTVWNRTEMHSGVRSATELLQQEIGQAGRIALPASPITLQTAVVIPAGTVPCVEVFGGGWSGGVTATVTLSSVAGMWAGTNNGIKLTVLDGDSSETIVQTRNAGTNEVTACSAGRTRSARRWRTRRVLAKGSSGRARVHDTLVDHARHLHERIERESAEARSATSTATARWCMSSTFATTAMLAHRRRTICIAT
jgi:prepilin-type N-terminal cleavage/methylation domain-containing protein